MLTLALTLTLTLTPTLTLTLTPTRTPTLTLTRCDLEFKGRRLQLRPALEELRTEFYREIKKFISIPTGFKGLGYFEEGAAGKHKVLKIFRDMPDRCLRSLQVVYEKASELFQNLTLTLALALALALTLTREGERALR